MLTQPQIIKLGQLCSAIRAASVSGDKIRLATYVTSTDLTPAFLLEAAPGFHNGYSVLQLIAENRYLPQVPPACLTSEMVWDFATFVNQEGERYHTSLLLFCAERGFYGDLPSQWQTQEVIVFQDELGGRKDSALAIAARYGHLRTLPLELLLAGDFEANILRYAVRTEQLSDFRHLIRPENIDVHVLVSYFRVTKLSDILLEYLTAERMLEDDRRGSTPLIAAAFGRHLGHVPAQLFVDHLPQAREQIGKAKVEIRRYALDPIEDRSQPIIAAKVAFAEETALAADKWIIEIAQHIIRGNGPPKKR